MRKEEGECVEKEVGKIRMGKDKKTRSRMKNRYQGRKKQVRRKGRKEEKKRSTRNR